VIIDALSTGDRVHLLELYARAEVLLELGHFKEWASLFEPQATVRCVRSGDALVIEEAFSGRDEIIKLGQRICLGQFDLGAGELVPPSRCRRFVSNISLSKDGMGRASGRALLAAIAIGTSDPRWISSGMYSDQLTKSASGCWRFASRNFARD
jgi:hypothetical protein